MTSHPQDQVWLQRFAWLTAGCTLLLICVGGLVTSHEAGMAVPDWPNSFGYNMFFFPVSKWIGNIRYEHAHRLVASGVGLLTTILAVWLALKEERRWMRWLGSIAFLAVVIQGVLGGLRVTLYKDEIGIFHAALAQSFFVFVCAIAFFLGSWWRKLDGAKLPGHAELRRAFALISAVIFVQLVIAATMRHQHAGLAIPDFPLAYGKVWPNTSDAAIQHYNAARTEVTGYKPITAFQVVLQMVHRIVAVVILASVVWIWRRTRRELGAQHLLARLALAWIILICLQVLLGAATIWTGKSADIATAHVAVGALSLLTGVMGSIISFALLAPAAYKTETSTCACEFVPDGARTPGRSAT